MPGKRSLVSVRRSLVHVVGWSSAVILAAAVGAGCGGIGEGGTGAIPEAGTERDASVHLSSSSSSGGSGSGASSDDGSGFTSDDGGGDDALGGDGAADDAGDDGGNGDASADGGSSSGDDASEDGASAADGAVSGDDGGNAGSDATSDGSSSGGSASDGSSGGGSASDASSGGGSENDATSSGGADGAAGGGDATVGPGDAGLDGGGSDATVGTTDGGGSQDGGTDGSTAHATDAGHDGGACDLAATWAVKLTVDVSWPSTGIVNAGGADNGDATEAVQIWALLKPTGAATGTSIPATILPCNIALPDFGSIIGETYGVTFPTTLFDHEPPNLTAVSTTLTLGGATAPTTFALPGETSLIGMSAPATGDWPFFANQVTSVDMDDDGEPGVTGLSKAPPAYSYIPTTIIPSLPDLSLVRADEVYMAIRFVTTSLSGTLTSCTAASGASGSVSVKDMDSHVVGCHVAGDPDGSAGDCTTGQANFVDGNRPVFTIDSASFTASVIATASCPAVRAALP
jgi:hypothetical protein